MEERLVKDKVKNLEKNDSKHGNNKRKDKSKKFTIFGYDIWRIVQYLIIYSIVGCIIETMYGLLTKGVIESRQSMLYIPFCAICGAGAILLLCIPKGAKKNNWTLFITGFILGSLLEYIVSWVGECIFHIKWWDYSEFPLNINGRICVIFSIFWGILTIILHKVINPTVDKIIEKIPVKIIHVSTIIIIIFIVIDFFVTSFALKMFSTRLIYNYDLKVQGSEDYYQEYLTIYQNNEGLREFVDKHFSDEVMLKTFPNIKFTLQNGDIIWVKDILIDIKPYYIKIF